MVIVIDAYNYIKHIIGDSFVSESLVKNWIDQFQEYTDIRGNDVLLVFDAGPGYYATKDYFDKLTVIYSGQTQTADDIIKEWLSSHRGQDILLVTSDREICDVARRMGVVSISSQDFYKIFTYVMQQEQVYEKQVEQTIHKTSTTYSQELDTLMEVGSRNLVREHRTQGDSMPLRVRNGKKASKQDKQLLKKIEKI